jgi:outer membrane receptor protein involved in Fe transport
MVMKHANTPGRLVRRGIAGLWLAFAVTGLALAGDALDVPVTFSVPAQSLGEALRALAKQADLQVLFAPALVDGRTSPAVSGKLSAREALQRMLSGTSLTAEEQSPGVVVVRERLRESRRSDAPTAREQAPPPPSDPAPADDLQEVVVTAQRRKERLQDVPLSVTAYSQTTMDAQGTRTIDDLSRLTPGVMFTRSANNNNSESAEISIRGIVSNAGAATTGVYIDDTPIHGRHLSFPSYNTYPALFDIERVEVLRGPQGTLFGAGSEGGTVRFISPEPSLDRYSLYARSELAGTSKGDPLYEAGFAAGGPIIENRVGFRASVSYRHEGGYVDRVNWHTGQTVDKDANSNSTVTARVAMKWAVGDAITVTPSLLYQKRDVDDTSAFWAPRPGQADPTDGQFDSPLRTGNAVASPTTDKFLLPALKVEWSLGAVQLVSSTSYFERKQNATTDYTQFDRGIFLGTPYSLPGESGSGFWADDQKNWTQELRLESGDADARITWTSGIFYQHARETTSHRVYDPPLLATLGLPADFGGGFIYVEDPRVGTDRQLALFGQANLKLTDRLRLTLGARYAEARFKGSAHYPETLVVGPQVTSSGSEKEHPFTPKLGLEYRIDADKLLYASAAKGFRIGGVNAKVGQFCYGPGGSLDLIGLEEVPPSYSSDSLWSYELGAKSSLASDRVLLNASAYFVKWKNIQQNVALGCGFQFTSNLGEADSKGFDVQTVIRPNDAISLGATVGYTDARFTKTVQLQPTVQSIVRDGDHLGASPWTAAAFAQVNFPAFGTQGYLRADYQYGAKQTDRTQFSNPLNGGYALWFEGVPEQSFTSLRTGLTWGGLDVSVFAQNLFDTRPRLTATQDIATPDGGTPLFYVISWRPRTIGFTATYHY